MSDGPAIAEWPQTIYGVAVLYVHRRDPDRRWVVSAMFVVSGDKPLTDDEAGARARQKCESCWNVVRCGPLADWGWERFSVSTIVQKRVPA